MPDGLLLLNKPTNISSHSVLGPVKRLFQTRKVGHTGTLDPFAEGLLIVLVGRGTKLARWFTGMDKTYKAVIKTGEQTDTLDPEGAVTHRCRPASIERLSEAAAGFRGQITQVPPKFSAIHVGGKRAYELARQGKNPEMGVREATIFDLQVRPAGDSLVEMDVRCSTGTYVRALARDIAAAAGSCGYLIQLTRTHIGPFSLANATTISDVKVTNLIPMQSAVRSAPDLQAITATAQMTDVIANGGKIQTSSFVDVPSGPPFSYAVFAPDGQLLAIVEHAHNKWHYAKVFA